MRKVLEVILLTAMIVILGWGVYLILSARRAPTPPRVIASPPLITPTPAVSVSTPIPPTPKPWQTSFKKTTFEKKKAPSLFSGRISTGEGKAAANVELRLYKNSDLAFHFDALDEQLFDAKPVLVTHTDNEGRYLFDAVPAGVYRLEVRSDDYAGFWVSVPLTFNLGMPFKDFDLVVTKGAPLSGTVLDAKENPASDADVLYTAKSAGIIYAGRTQTGRDGRFNFPHVPKDTDLFVVASRKGSAAAFGDDVRIQSTSTTESLTLALGNPIPLKGCVFDENGKPASGAEIFAEVIIETPNHTRTFQYKPVHTDKNGEFTFNTFPPGTVMLTIRNSGKQHLLMKNIELEEGKIPEELTLTLKAGKTFSGVVVDDEGTSIANAVIFYGAYDEAHSTRTNARGEFVLRGVDDRSTWIVAFANNTSSIMRRDVTPGTDDLRLVLHQGATVMGTIRAKGSRSPLSRAIFGARVRGYTEERITNARGEFQAHFIPEEAKAKTHASAKGFARKTGPVLNLHPLDFIEGVNFLLGEGGRISGHILEEGTNEPIAGARVSGSGDSFEPVYSDEQGRYIIERAPVGRVTIHVYASGYRSPRARRIVSKDGEEISGVDFYLKKESQISGVVRNKNGEPIAMAIVGANWGRLRRITGSFLQQDTQTDADGKYTLKHLPPSEALMLQARHDDYAPGETGPFTLKPGEHKENVNIVLTEGGKITGKIKDEKGESLSKAEVGFSQGIGKFIGANIGTVVQMLERGEFSDAKTDGTYELKHLAPASYYILARADGYVYEMRPDIEVKEGETTSGVDFKLKPAVTLAGVVKDDEGNLIKDAHLFAMSLNFQAPAIGMTRSDTNGIFRIDGLAPHTYMVTVEKDPYPSLIKQNVKAPDENLELVLESGGIIRGIVLDDKTREPVTDYKIVAEYTPSGFFPGGANMMAGERFNRSRDVSDPDGAFEIRGVKEGKYKLKVTAAGYAKGVKSGIRVKNGKTIDGIVISLKAGSSVEGRVVAALDKTPVAGANVKVAEGGTNLFGMDRSMFERGPEDYASATNQDGEFKVVNIPPGITTLEVTRDGFLKGKKIVFVKENEPTKDVEIALSKGGIVVGRVVSKATGQPLSDADVTFTGQGFIADIVPFFGKNIATDIDGRFRFETVPTGKQTLKISHENYSTKLVENLDIKEGETLDIGEVALTSGGGISGIVLDVKGNPVVNAFLMAQGPSGFRHTSSDEKGEYAFEELTPGTYTVSLVPNQELLMSGQAENSQEQQALVEEGKVTELNFILTPGYRLSGQVTQNGKPVTGVNVSYQLADLTQLVRGGGNKEVDDEGRYEFTELQPGLYNISVYRGQMQQPYTFRPLFNGSLNLEQDTVYDIELPTMSISGNVKDAETGEAIAGARVSIVRSTDPHTVEDVIRTGRWGGISDTTDSNGHYELEEVQEGELSVVVQHKEYAYDMHPLTLTVGESKTGIDFALHPGLSIKGRAILRESGSPVGRLFIHLLDSQGVALKNDFVTVDSDGRFTISGLREGSYTINAYPQGAAPLYGVNVSVNADSENVLALEFSPGGTLIVDVHGQDDKPVKKAKVDLIDASGQIISYPANLDSLLEYNAKFFTDDSGHLERPNIPVGTYTLRVSATGYQKHSEEITINDNQSTTLKILLAPSTPEPSE